MPELLLALGLLFVGAYGYAVQRVLAQRHHHGIAASAARMPTPADEAYLSAARDHYRRLARWARLLEDLRRDDLVWPLLPAPTKTLVEQELDEFYRL